MSWIRGVRPAFVLGVLVLIGSTPALAGDRQVRPFVGATFAGSTAFVPNLEETASGLNIALGANGAWLGEIFGVEADVAYLPGLFGSGETLVRSSRVTTISGNVIIAAPHRLTEYALRPYAVVGGGLMRIRTTTALNVFDLATTMPAFDLGAGALGFITNRVGLCWEVRRFQGRRSTGENGVSLGTEHLSFWRGTMAVVIRY
jgi:hypothetical protein